MSQMSKRHYVKGGFHSGILICKQYLTFGVALFDSILSCPSYLIFFKQTHIFLQSAGFDCTADGS